MPVLRLGDGRALAYEQFGDLQGSPVVLLHGVPGSRLFCPDERVTRARNVRLVTFDRPGYGGSDPLADRRVLDTAPDFGALLDHLGLDRAGVVGWSGGGPFAIGCAAAVPDRLTRLAVVSSPGSLDEVPGAWERLDDYRRPTAEMARRDAGRAARAVIRHTAPYVADPASFLGSGRGPDGPVLRGPARAMLLAQATEALRQGSVGVAADLLAMWWDWGFRVVDLTVPVTAFHGGRDRNNGPESEWLAANTADGHLVVWPDDGHLGVVPHWGEVLDAVAGG